MLKHILKLALIVLLFVNWQSSEKCTEMSFAENDEVLSIRIFSQIKVQSFIIKSEIGNYSLWANGIEILNTITNPLIKLTCINDSIELKSADRLVGKFKRIKFSCADQDATFQIKMLLPERKPRLYQDNMLVDVEQGYLKCVNEIELDNYIGGVVQAESGRLSHPEFYKVQTILARTFALAHIQKHALEGFSLCDHTHCQAYFGKPTELNIIKSVFETKNKIVVDENLNLIEAAFHSNSGGQTLNSEDVWGSKLSYLRSVNDTFSLKMPNAKWERKIAKDDWLSYLKIKHNYPIDDEDAKLLAFNFKQDTRKPFLESNNIKVPLKIVRTDFQLNSTYFSIMPKGDSLIFKGKGFGHGVGMCQEGAMRMAKLGYTYLDILNFYYQNTQLIDLRLLDFFKDE
jgi:stage II sporulation protein D